MRTRPYSATPTRGAPPPRGPSIREVIVKRGASAEPPARCPGCGLAARLVDPWEPESRLPRLGAVWYCGPCARACYATDDGSPRGELVPLPVLQSRAALERVARLIAPERTIPGLPERMRARAREILAAGIESYSAEEADALREELSRSGEGWRNPEPEEAVAPDPEAGILYARRRGAGVVVVRSRGRRAP